MNKQQKKALRKLARKALKLCGSDVDYISIHADIVDNVPYAAVRADLGDAHVYSWYEFPKEDEDE